MKKVLMLVSVLGVMLGLTSCSQQSMAKNYGGSYTYNLPTNTKLVNVTWKDEDSLWYLTKPMQSNDIAETYTFQQDSQWGIFEGTVTIVESKK